MEEAELFKFGDDLRKLFVNQLIFNTLVDSLTLFNKHKSVNGNCPDKVSKHCWFSCSLVLELTGGTD